MQAVSRFFQLWRSSQWKRERFAVSFHIDTYNVDPRSYLRFPVLSAKIEEEVTE
jgi:NAD+ synthase (glutamine-hydrolysing)